MSSHTSHKNGLPCDQWRRTPGWHNALSAPCTIHPIVTRRASWVQDASEWSMSHPASPTIGIGIGEETSSGGRSGPRPLPTPPAGGQARKEPPARLPRALCSGSPGSRFLYSRFLSSADSAGTTLNKSPTTPYCASLKIGASGSLLIATMTLAVRIPARCWIAPEIPQAM